MYILGINGSPRKNGNSRLLMSLFMEQAQQNGARTRTIDAVKLEINHCVGCGVCEKKGGCVFEDDFKTIVLPEIIKADVVVLASPVYFYGFPADIKALIDRIQVMWSRKYRVNTDDFKNRDRKGILLAVGATRGKDLFDGLKLTARYFFDAADIEYFTDLCFRGVDEKGDMAKHPTVKNDIRKLLETLMR